jgi:hypothetical protein
MAAAVERSRFGASGAQCVPARVVDRPSQWPPRIGGQKDRIMNAFSISFEGHLLDYQADYRRSSDVDKSRRTRRTGGTKRGVRPTGFNGMHRRRQRRWTW